jgi:hypothetical protein
MSTYPGKGSTKIIFAFLNLLLLVNAFLSTIGTLGFLCFSRCDESTASIGDCGEICAEIKQFPSRSALVDSAPNVLVQASETVRQVVLDLLE